ncbi:haloacid dehalogenase [Phototrophicus methaneseepsis]|uniref:Haloacid dehalogenase n=1 Tax=Phototrophicus methaneseepsis TaxID=2710758 RepID=A0A7S8E8G9_9CHLR|nr:haloacid dehalogenase [Phototrophicus methaneseepsis]QPC82316.1 haloacid dehalogenase [Phototrophicus methaneseepsis]
MQTGSLNDIADSIRTDFTEKNEARDKAIALSRELIRYCSQTIRAIHRREWDRADEQMAEVDNKAAELRAVVLPYPELYHTGYTQDGFKEMVEAHATYAIIKDGPLTMPKTLQVESSTYLLGLAEAATELRRFILDILRREHGDMDEAERLLTWMDDIYDQLVTFDFPDALTHGLRRQTDIVRSVLERTRGDMTQSIRQQRMQEALAQFEAKFVASTQKED